jgi:rhodanese-related sulfurtransferase
MGLSKWLPFGRVPEMGADDLNTMREGGRVQVLDVRTGPEYDLSHIPGARHLPIHHFNQEAVRALSLDPEKPVAAICLSAHRSIPAVRQLREMGYEAKQLAGGMKAWWKKGLPTQSKGG